MLFRTDKITMIENINKVEDSNISDAYQTSSNLYIRNMDVTEDKQKFTIVIFKRKVLKNIYGLCKDINIGKSGKIRNFKRCIKTEVF